MNINKNINQQIEICKNTYYNDINIFQTSYLLSKTHDKYDKNDKLFF